MGKILGVSRKTVSLAYEELEAQGWVNIHASRGAFINPNIPVIKPKSLIGHAPQSQSRSSFRLRRDLHFLEEIEPPEPTMVKLVIDTGYPDVRLTPSRELAQRFSRVLNDTREDRILNYASDFRGHPKLREEIARYLGETRGIAVDKDGVLVTRGSLMAFMLIFTSLLKRGDFVAVGNVSFKVAKDIIKLAGGHTVPVPIDDHGLDVDALGELCQSKKIRAVFVMPHHHHPTTVSLPAERRMLLLELAERHGMAIIEDDYDYDFHYQGNPLLPMASTDHGKSVIYVGSFSKTVAPSLRTGFVVAPPHVLTKLTTLSRFMDCHGNTALERAIAYLFSDGVIRRYLKKALKVYRARRDLFCKLLQEFLGSEVSFQMPEGGLAVWVTFAPELPLDQVRERSLQHGLQISRTIFKDSQGSPLNSIRMGFASLNHEEMVGALHILRQAISECKKQDN